jgi:ABC-2 type transport system ATP-binding protein
MPPTPVVSPRDRVAPAPTAATPDHTVVFEGVVRSFGTHPALTGLTLRVPHARITVLLGPNGAGKTTATRVITGALGPQGGTVTVFGLDPTAQGEEVRRRCGVVSAKPSLYDRLTGFDNLAYAAELYGLGRGATVEPRIREAAARFGIDHALAQQAGAYSTGMKTRLALARAVLHEPDLLLLDEPTSGLDPESSVAVLDMIRDMTAGGATVVMCTHLLLEAEGLADHVVVLQDGKDLVSGTPAALTEQFWPGAMVRIEAEDPATLDWLGTPSAAAIGVQRYQRPHRGPAVVDLDDLVRVPDLIASLLAAGVRLTRVEPRVPTLEDLYFAVRGYDRAGGDGRLSVPRDNEHINDTGLSSGNRIGRRFKDPFSVERS